ncbi:MAG TPA: magnesium transporter CorA family protein [Rhizomicrobium sp.]|jgi:magnesium transporter
MRVNHPASGTPPIWIDLLDPAPDEAERILTDHGLHLPSRAQLEEIESSSRLQARGGSLFLSMPIAVQHDGIPATPTPVGFVLSSKFLVTIRYVDLAAFAATHEAIADDGSACTPASIFAALLEHLVDFGADALEHVSAEMNAISQQIFPAGMPAERKAPRSRRSLRETLATVGRAGERVSHIRETLLALQRFIPFVCDKCAPWIGADVQSRLKTAGTDIQSLVDFEAHLTNKVQFLLDAVLGFINTEQNEIFKVLTIVSVVGIPPTLIASMYGMNFHNMPEYSWSFGYQWGLGLIFLSALLPALWFKWRGWW